MVTERVLIVVNSRGARAASAGIRTIGGSARTAAASVGLLTTAIGLLGAAFGARAIINAADSFTRVQRAIDLSTRATGDNVAVQRELLAISNRTTTALTDNASLFQRLRIATNDLGASNQDVLDVVEGLNAALILSGTSAQEARGGLQQLGQALASGRLGGDELRSVLESLPSLAQALSAELGEELGGNLDVTVGRLRELGSEGRLTGAVVFPALQRAVANFSGELANVPRTVGETVNVLRNNFLSVIGELNNEIGGTSGLNELIILLAENLRGIVLTSAAALADGLVVAANAGLALVDTFLTIQEFGRNVVGTFLQLQLSIAEFEQSVNELDFTGLLVPDSVINEGRARVASLTAEVDRYATNTFEAGQETERLRETLDGIADSVGGLGRVADSIRAIRDAGADASGSVSTIRGEDRTGGGGDGGAADAARVSAFQELLDISRNLRFEELARQGGIGQELALIDEQIAQAVELQRISGEQLLGEQTINELIAQRAQLVRDASIGQQIAGQLATDVAGGFSTGFANAVRNGTPILQSFADTFETQAEEALIQSFDAGFSALEEGLDAAFGAVADSLTGIFGPAFEGLSEGFGEVLSGVLGFVANQALAALFGGGGNSSSSSSANVSSAVTSTEAVRGIVAGPQEIAIAQVDRAIGEAFEPATAELRVHSILLRSILDAIVASGGTVTGFGAETATLAAGGAPLSSS